MKRNYKHEAGFVRAIEMRMDTERRVERGQAATLNEMLRWQIAATKTEKKEVTKYGLFRHSA